MTSQGPCEVIAMREGHEKLVVDTNDLDEVAFDRYNEETFAEMGGRRPEDETQLSNSDPKKEEAKTSGEILTLINSSFNSMDLRLTPGDRELSKHPQMPEGSGGSHQRPQQPTSWSQKQFDDLQSPPSANNGKRVTFQQDRRAQAMFPQNAGNHPDERSMRELDELLRADPYQDHARTRYVSPQTSSLRRSSSSSGCGHMKEPQRNVNLPNPYTSARRSGSFRQDNFDLRNAETFGMDGVDRQPFAAVPTKSPNLPYSRTEEEVAPLQSLTRYSEDNSRFPEIRDPRLQDLYFDTYRKLQTEPMHSHLEQTKEDLVTQELSDMHAALEHLKNIAELIPKIEIMEDVFDRLTDPEDPPREQVRMELLDLLKHHVTPQSVLPFSKMVHARRLLMHSLSVMSREKRYRAHVVEILGEIFMNLEKLLSEDRNDGVFILKTLVFQRMISKCNMEEIIRLTRCLWANNTGKAVESTLGLWFISCLLETAANLDYESYPIWVETLLPKFKTHLLSLPRSLVVEWVMRPALEHLVDNTKSLLKPKPTPTRYALP